MCGVSRARVHGSCCMKARLMLTLALALELLAHDVPLLHQEPVLPASIQLLSVPSPCPLVSEQVHQLRSAQADVREEYLSRIASFSWKDECSCKACKKK